MHIGLDDLQGLFQDPLDADSTETTIMVTVSSQPNVGTRGLAVQELIHHKDLVNSYYVSGVVLKGQQ